MNLTFLKLSSIVVFLFSIQASHAALYTAFKSGNFSDTATWYGKVVPPTTVDTDVIRVPSGINVTLDRNIILNSPNAEINFIYTGGPSGQIISTSTNYISVAAGNIRGIGIIDIDSMYVGIPLFLMSGTLSVNKLALNATEINPIYSININIRKEVRLAGGNSIINRSAAVLSLDTNADLVYGGGILGVGPNSLNVSKGYNIRYMSISYVHNSIHSLNTLNEFEVAVGAGNTLRMTADVTIPKKLLLTSGSFKTDGYALTFASASSIAPGGAGNITGTASTTITVQSTLPEFGTIRFSGSIGTFRLWANTKVQLGSDLYITNAFEQQFGMFQLNGHDLVLSASSLLIGGSASGYIMTNNSGQLKQNIAAAGTKYYSVGTEQHFAPVIIGNNTSANYADIGVSASDTIYSQGTYGYNMVLSEPIVDAAWTVTGNSSNIDFSIEPQWDSANEKNGFDANNCYVAGFLTGQWDKAPGAVATISGSTKTIKRASVSNFGVFAVADKNAFLSIANPDSSQSILSLYPNPATSNINLHYTGKANAGIAIYDAAGRIIKTFSISNGVNNTDISELPPGVYYINSMNAPAYSGTKFLKQ